MHRPCLVLNQDYMPLNIIPWTRAISFSPAGPKNSLIILSYYSDLINGVYQLPAVAVTKRYINRKRYIPKINRWNLFIRDNQQCQYCGCSVSHSGSTIDHVIPRHMFKNQRSAHKWENVVLACYRCNSKKGGRTPNEANMKLLSKPRIPNFISLKMYNFDIPNEWLMYVKV